MTEVMKARLQEVVPDRYLQHMSVTDTEKAVKVAFEIVGYTPKSNLQMAIDRAWGKSTATKLWEFVYDAWRLDNGS